MGNAILVAGLLVVMGLQLNTIWRINAMADDIQNLTDAEATLATAVDDALAELTELSTDITTLTANLAAAQASGDAAAIEGATAALKDKAAALEGAVAAAKAATSAKPGSTTQAPAPPAVVLSLSPDTLPDAVLGQPYTAQVVASGGEAPYAYSTADLPPGLVLAAGGGISGTPAGPAGTTAVTVAAHDGNSDSGSITYQLAVVDPTPVEQPAPEAAPADGAIASGASTVS